MRNKENARFYTNPVYTWNVILKTISLKTME